VASQDYRNDIVVSEERIAKVAETYRGIRNTLRYQLSNLYDFDPAKHSVADDKLTGLDRWILSKFSVLEKEIIAAYDAYEFHVVYQKISQFIAVELSSIYHDVVKDRLYTDAANSPRRRSTQTALHRIVTGLCKMLAPILAFTADEAWEFLAEKLQLPNYVHFSDWEETEFMLSESELKQWAAMLKFRDLVLGELEKARQLKKIGKALEAKVVCFVESASCELASKIKNDLRELLNVSELEIQVAQSGLAQSGARFIFHKGTPIEAAGDVVDDEGILITRADGEKCERCWHWKLDLGSNPEHPTICRRCFEAVNFKTESEV